MISDKEMRKRIEDMSPQELLKASETFEALFDLVHQQDNNSIANTNPDYYKGVYMQGDERIDKLMLPVLNAINRHVKDRDDKTDIYNRAYEAIIISMEENTALREQVRPVYVVTMYRYGEREKHSYVYGAFSTEATAREWGEKEKDYRGGKYEPEIIKFYVDSPTDFLVVKHV